MNTHTPERYGADINGEVIYCPDGEYIYYSEYQKLEQQRDDLLARIHRDGGHYAEENGIDKAIDDAHIKVAELYLQREELLAELQKIAGTDFIGVPPRHVIYQITEIAREAIAKVRGQHDIQR